MECHFCSQGVQPFYPVHQVVDRQGNSLTIGDQKQACHTCRHTRTDLLDREAVLQHLQMQAQAESMDEPNRAVWIERALRAISATIPKVEHGTWSRWERLVPHIQSLASHLQPQSLVKETAAVFQQTGWYLTERARYQEAGPLLEQALARSRGSADREPSRHCSSCFNASIPL